jgi:hypothetical protein
MQYSEHAVDDRHALALAEALAEGIVRANMETIEVDPDSFPCCCGCGEYKLAALFLDVGTFLHLQVKGPQSLETSKIGTAFDLACFQCAQRRREGEDDAYVKVSRDEHGYLKCVVMRTKGACEDMEVHAPKHGACDGEACDCET